MSFDIDALAICLFFAKSPVLRHREWVKKQLNTNPELAALAEFQGFVLGSPRIHGPGLDVLNREPIGYGISAALTEMAQCNSQAESILRRENS